jgi:predicted dehydrogenase
MTPSLLENEATQTVSPRALTAPVRLVVVGANFGAKIARQLESDPAGPVRVAGVCDLDEAKGRALAGELGAVWHASLDAVLADPSVEAVGLFTGPIGRGRLIERIVAAGKHVMTTKPFELEPAEAARAFEAAARFNRVLHVNSPSPLPSSDLARMQAWLADGTLGLPVMMRASTWADYRERADGSWQDDPARCPGGPLFRLGVYFLNDFAGLLGRPVEVHVQHARMRTGRPTPDNAQISIIYDNGALASVFASFCVGDGEPYRDEVILACERGTVRRWMVRTGSVDMHRDQAMVELSRPGRAPERFLTAPGDYSGWYNWRAFQAAVRGLPGAVRNGADSAVAGVRLLHAMARSASSLKSERV